MDIRDSLWDKQSQIKDIRRQIEYNNEQNDRLMKKWGEHYNSMTNYIVGNEKDVLSKLDFSAVLEIIRSNKPCIKSN